MSNISAIPNYSVIVCAYNARQRIQPTLEHLANLDYPADKYEVIVVDNCCTDGTAAYATECWELSQSKTSFKIVYERTPGLSHARWAGVRASCGRYCLFCDDDNWLSTDYLQVADRRFAIEGDRILLGGAGVPVIDGGQSDFPPYLFSSSSMFAIGAQSIFPEDITLKQGWLFGAGLMIPAKALRDLDADGFRHKLSGRKGKQLSSGDDLELCFALVMRGLRVFSDPNLTFKHQIPGSRLSLNYLKELNDSLFADDVELDKYRKIIALLRQKSILRRIASATLDLLRTPNRLTFEGLMYSLVQSRFNYRLLPVTLVKVKRI